MFGFIYNIRDELYFIGMKQLITIICAQFKLHYNNDNMYDSMPYL